MTKKLLITAIVLMIAVIGAIGVKLIKDISKDNTPPSSEVAANSEKNTVDSEVEKSSEKEEEEKETEEKKEEEEKSEEEEESESAENQEEEAYTPEPEPQPQTYTPSAERIPGEADCFYDTESYLVCANKKHPLPDGYEPYDLAYPVVNGNNLGKPMRWDAAVALENMFIDAQKDGVYMTLLSAYRSAAYQAQLWNGYANQYGAATADTISSRPGYSDHQTGLAADIGSSTASGNDLSQSFFNTVEGQWLYKNAYKYGFIMRYPVGKDYITGYAYEPWHYRYVGVNEATSIYSSDPDMSFEEYYGVAGGDYAN